ncbi:MAG TPA: hypothetical protein VM600_06020, partial [Actinomycetota bacterium]|nr:hypothetical protein [Actinomycetota bacterium]
MPQPVLEGLLQVSSALDEACSVLEQNRTLTVVEAARAPVLAALGNRGERWLIVTATARDADRLIAELR